MAKFQNCKWTECFETISIQQFRSHVQLSKMTKIKHPKLKNPIEKYFNVITRYHYFFFFIVFIAKVPVLWHLLSLIFLSPPMSFTCELENGTIGRNICPCDEPVWDTSVFTKTLQTKFGLYCETNWLISFSESISYIGLLVGSLVFGFLADRFGRLSMFSFSCLILAVTGCLVSIMPGIALFIVMRFIEGIGSGGATVTSFVLCIEYCGVRHRETVTALYHLPINLGHIMLAGVSYVFRNFDDYQLAISVPVFLLVATKWILMESPKWLLDNDHCEEAVVVMEKFCCFNRESHENIRADLEGYFASIKDKQGHKIKFYQIFQHKKLCMNFGCMAVIYFVCGMGYYGVSQFIGKMSGNIHLNVAISGTLLLPGTIISVFLLQSLGRRPFLISTMFLSGIFMLVDIGVPEGFMWLRVIIACICNTFFFMSFIIVFLYGVELYPTSVRNTVLGFLSVMARSGQIVGPQINSLSSTASGAIFGALAIMGAFLAFPLSETKNIELPSTLQDSETLGRKVIKLEEDPGYNFLPPQPAPSN